MEQINSPHSFTFLDWGTEDITFQYESTSLAYHGWGWGWGWLGASVWIEVGVGG